METKDILKALRKSKGFATMQEFCTAIGISFSTYQNYETGKRIPTAEMLVKLADFYNVSTDYLLGRVGSSDLATDADLNERIALQKWLSLDNEKRAAVLVVMESLIKAYESAGIQPQINHEGLNVSSSQEQSKDTPV